MAKNSDQLRTGRDFINYAEDRGARIREGKGSHRIVCTDRGSVPVPVHGNETLGRGLRHAILKQFASIGIGIVIVGFIIHQFV